jgi:hypothetical protein
MPAHLTAMDGGNAAGLQEQSRPCARRRLAKNGVFHQPAIIEARARDRAPLRRPSEEDWT